MKTPALLVVFGSFIWGCEPYGRTVEPNDLGIAELDIHRDRVGDERLLTVRGLDQDGETIATATLRTGMVLYGADVTPELHAGTELTITIGARNESFVSPDRVPHVIYERLSPKIDTFVRLPAVATEIDREAGIRFAPAQAPNEEIAFTTSSCSGSRFPTNKGGANQCCQDGANTYHVNPTTLAVANRSTYAPSYPSIPICRKSDGTTGCTTNCMYGPCGSAVISTKGTNGHVFHPNSNPNVCGWDDGGPGGLGVDYSPEHYTSQTLWGGVTPTCSCNGCNADGTPICQLLVASYLMDGSLADATGRGHTATCQSGKCPVSTSGVHANAMAFDGTNDIATVAYTSDFATTQGFTVAMWMKFSPPGNVYSCPVNKAYGSASDNSWQLCVDGSQMLFFYSRSATGSEDLHTGTNAITRNAWYHVALRWNAATNLKEILVNGTQVMSGTASIVFDGSDITIGADIDAGTALAWFPGSIDDLRIYNYAIDDATLAALATP